MFRWKNKNFLVTGAGGFIGSHLVDALVNQGAKVTGLIHYNSRNDWGKLKELSESTLRKIKVQLGDIRDPSLVDQMVQKQDTIFHLAALVAIPYSYQAARSFIDTNVLGTHNILEACRKNRVRRMIHTSTSEVYGTAQYVPIDETHPLQGHSPYSASKIGAEKIVESYSRSYNLAVTTIRPFNTFGPRQSLRAVIPTIVTQIISGAKRLHLGRQDTIRDFMFVDDLTRAFILMAESDRVIGNVVNIGTGIGWTVRDLVHQVCKIVNREGVKIITEKERLRPDQSEVKRLICCADKAHHILQWQPRVTLEVGLKKVIKYFKQNKLKSSSSSQYVI